MPDIPIEFLSLPAIVILGLVLFFFATLQRRLRFVEQRRSDEAAKQNSDKEKLDEWK